MNLKIVKVETGETVGAEFFVSRACTCGYRVRFLLRRLSAT
jgi:hypothetical protein